MRYVPAKLDRSFSSICAKPLPSNKPVTEKKKAKYTGSKMMMSATSLNATIFQTNVVSGDFEGPAPTRDAASRSFSANVL